MSERSSADSGVPTALARDRLGVTAVMFFILAGVAPLPGGPQMFPMMRPAAA